MTIDPALIDEESYGSWRNTRAPKRSTTTSKVTAKAAAVPDPEGYGGAAIYDSVPSVSGPSGVGGVVSDGYFAATPPTQPATTGPTAPAATVVQTFTDADGELWYIWSDGTRTKAGINNGAKAAEAAKRESAWKILEDEFKRYGLGDLVKVLKDTIMQGASYEEQLIKLRQSDVYKKRFAANDERIKKGLRALSEAEYIGLEDGYSEVMRKYGLPSWYTELGEYGRQKGLETFIANDVSAIELEGRIQKAADAVLGADPYYRKSLQDYYGMGTGDMIAFVLDPSKTLPVIEQRANAIAFGAAAQRQGVAGIYRGTAESFGGRGVNKAQSEAGFSDIAMMLPDAQRLGNIYKDTYGTSDALKEVFDQDATTAKKRRRLVQRETDTFSGSSGVQRGSLSQGTQGLL